MRTRPTYFGSVPAHISISFISCHQTPGPSPSTRAPSNRQQLFVTLGCGSMPSCLCASTSHGCRKRASTTCVVCVLYNSNLAATSLQDWCRLSFCRDLTTVTLSSSGFQPRHWHRCRESLMRQHGLWLVWDLVITWPMLCTSCNGYRSHNASSTKFASWFISRSLPDYIIDLLTPADTITAIITIVKQQQSHSGKTKDRGQSVLCRCTSHLESSSYRVDHAIDYCIQETSENLFLFSSVYWASRASHMTV